MRLRKASKCGISLRLLHAIREDVVKQLGKGVTTAQVVEGYIKPRITAASARFVDLLLPSCSSSVDVGVPLYFVSHAWARPFVETVEAVLEHLSSAADTTRVW